MRESRQRNGRFVWLQLVGLRRIRAIEKAAVVLDRVMDIDSVQRPKHLFHEHANLTFRFALTFLFDLLSPQERTGKHHVGKLIGVGLHDRFWNRGRSRLGSINRKIHVLYFLRDFKFVSKATGGRPNKQIRRRARLDWLDEHFVRFSLNLEVRTASSRHRDRLMKFKDRQVVQGGRYVDDGIRAGSARLLGQCSDRTKAVYKDERNSSSHNSFLRP